LVNKAGGVGGGQGVFSARPTGDSKTAGASGPTFGGTHGTPASSAGKAPGLAGTVAGGIGSIFGGKGPAPGGSGVFSPTQPGSGAPSAGNANAGGPQFTTISGAKVPTGSGSIGGVPRGVVGGALGAVATMASFGSSQMANQVDLNTYVGQQLMTTGPGGSPNQMRNQAVGGSRGQASGNRN